MLPVMLDPHKINILVIGNGPATTKRLEMLDAAGASYQHLSRWERSQSTSFKEAPGDAGEGLDMPQTSPATTTPETLSRNQRFRPLPMGEVSSPILFVADFDDATSAEIYHTAKAQGFLVNVEDKKDYCDFHVPAMVRRGELLFTISTGGASPRLARRLRHMLETLFPPAWNEWLETIKQSRNQWKAEGATFQELAEKTDALLDENGWLKQDCACLRDLSKHSTLAEARTTPLPLGEVAERSDAGEGFGSMHSNMENEGNSQHPHPKSAMQISTSPSGRGTA